MQILLTSDMHLREDNPICRLDDFQEHQKKVFKEVMSLAKECNLWLDAGDAFHKARPSLKFVNDILRLMNGQRVKVYVAAGNHDLPAHAICRLNESGLGMLCAGGVASVTCIELYKEFGIELFPYNVQHSLKGVNIVVTHQMVYPSAKETIPDVEGAIGVGIFNQYKNVALCVSGHNHTPFTCKNRKGQLLVNPGGITVQTADKQNQIPCVYIYDTESHKVEKIKLDHDITSVTREHIDKRNDNAERVSSFRIFIQGLIECDESTLSFRTVVEKAMQEAKPIVSEKVHEALEGK